MLLQEGFQVTSCDASDKMLKYALKTRWERRKEDAFDKWGKIICVLLGILLVGGKVTTASRSPATIGLVPTLYFFRIRLESLWNQHCQSVCLDSGFYSESNRLYYRYLVRQISQTSHSFLVILVIITLFPSLLMFHIISSSIMRVVIVPYSQKFSHIDKFSHICA